MSKRRFYITTAIPYVNGDPHIGHALEFVQADVLARHRRQRSGHVRFLGGTDDNALKNVEAAEPAGLPVGEFVNVKAHRFADLGGPLQLSYDDFIRTSVDPRHRIGVERLWRACAEAVIFTSVTTRACTAPAARRSSRQPSSRAASARSTATGRSRSQNATGSSVVLGTGTCCSPRSRAGACGSSPSTVETRC